MPVGRAERRESRRRRVIATFDEAHADSALDLIELLEFAWHDCYSEITPPDDVVDDILTLSGGTLSGLIGGAHLALSDRRDARIAADELRRGDDVR